MTRFEKHDALWLLLLIVPVLLNWMIGCDSAGWEVAGKVDSWVAFWGSYAGGCITAVISYIILRRTISYYREENTSRQAEAHRTQLRTDLSTRLAKLNVKKYGLLRKRLEEGEKASEICEMLDGDVIELWNDFSSFKILYMGEYDHFISDYETVIKSVQNAISNLSNGIRGIPDYGAASTSRAAMISNSESLFEHLEGLEERVDGLWKEANRLVK